MASHVVADAARRRPTPPRCVGEQARLREELERDAADRALEELGDDPDARALRAAPRRRRARRRRDVAGASTPAGAKRPRRSTSSATRVAIAASRSPSSTRPARATVTVSSPSTQVGEPAAPRLATSTPRSAARELDDRFRLRRFLVGAAGKRLGREILPRAHQRRQRPVTSLRALVGLALGGERTRRRIEREGARATHLRQVEQLGDLGPDLGGLGVDARAAAEHEIERLAAERRRERAGGRERVGPGERAIAEMDPAVGPERETIGQRLARRRRPHRQHDDLAAVLGAELDRPQAARARRTSSPRAGRPRA